MITERITDYHAKYFAYELTRQRRGGDVDRLATSLFDASVDLNPHQIDAALFALSRVDRAIARPGPPQIRACTISALGSSIISFAEGSALLYDPRSR
jgi:hypothetical protein